jgi:hypothetical protein
MDINTKVDEEIISYKFFSDGTIGEVSEVVSELITTVVNEAQSNKKGGGSKKYEIVDKESIIFNGEKEYFLGLVRATFDLDSGNKTEKIIKLEMKLEPIKNDNDLYEIEDKIPDWDENYRKYIDDDEVATAVAVAGDVGDVGDSSYISRGRSRYPFRFDGSVRPQSWAEQLMLEAATRYFNICIIVHHKNRQNPTRHGPNCDRAPEINLWYNGGHYKSIINKSAVETLNKDSGNCFFSSLHHQLYLMKNRPTRYNDTLKDVSVFVNGELKDGKMQKEEDEAERYFNLRRALVQEIKDENDRLKQKLKKKPNGASGKFVGQVGKRRALTNIEVFLNNIRDNWDEEIETILKSLGINKEHYKTEIPTQLSNGDLDGLIEYMQNQTNLAKANGSGDGREMYTNMDSYYNFMTYATQKAEDAAN